MTPSKKQPGLEDRFLEPKGWRTHQFINHQNGHRLHYGSVFPAQKDLKAVVVVLPGLSEFSEKYYELASNMLDRGFAFWIMDWQGQGRSGRYLANRHKRHAQDFDDDIADLHLFLRDYVKPSALHPKKGRLPLIMLGHSMGAALGMRYLQRYSDIFDAAAFSAPLLGVRDFNLPLWLGILLTGLLYPFHKKYVPGGLDYDGKNREDFGNSVFSSDPLRDSVHKTWSDFDPVLQIGSPTIGWLHHALRLCQRIQKPTALKTITIPCLFATAGKDKIVANKPVKNLEEKIQNAAFLDLPEAQHEILMESDSIRGKFLDAFDQLLEKNNLLK